METGSSIKREHRKKNELSQYGESKDTFRNTFLYLFISEYRLGSVPIPGTVLFSCGGYSQFSG